MNIKVMLEDIRLKIGIAYNTQKVGKYFSLKESINHMYQNCVFYKFTCSSDLNNQYIGETKRQYFIRTKEHVTPTNSAVFKHIKYCEFCTNCNKIYNFFEIVKTSSSYNDLLSTESLLIKNFNLI